MDEDNGPQISRLGEELSHQYESDDKELLMSTPILAAGFPPPASHISDTTTTSPGKVISNSAVNRTQPAAWLVYIIEEHV